MLKHGAAVLKHTKNSEDKMAVLQEIWEWFSDSYEMTNIEPNKYFADLKAYLKKHYIDISNEPYTQNEYYEAFGKIMYENDYIPYFG